MTLDIEAREILPGDMVPTDDGPREVLDVDQDTMLNPSGRGYGMALVAWLAPEFGRSDIAVFAPSEMVCVERGE